MPHASSSRICFDRLSFFFDHLRSRVPETPDHAAATHTVEDDPFIKSTCLPQLTLRPYVVHIWSLKPPESDPSETLVVHRVAGSGSIWVYLGLSGSIWVYLGAAIWWARALKNRALKSFWAQRFGGPGLLRAEKLTDLYSTPSMSD